MKVLNLNRGQWYLAWILLEKRRINAKTWHAGYRKYVWRLGAS